jgi:hypothetical protein
MIADHRDGLRYRACVVSDSVPYTHRLVLGLALLAAAMLAAPVSAAGQDRQPIVLGQAELDDLLAERSGRWDARPRPSVRSARKSSTPRAN